MEGFIIIMVMNMSELSSVPLVSSLSSNNKGNIELKGSFCATPIEFIIMSIIILSS